MSARHYRLEYNVNNGPWLLGRADEAPGPGKEFEVPGLPEGTHAVKLRLVPLVGDPAPVLSNEVIIQVGQPAIVEPLLNVGTVEVTLADIVVRRDALLAAAGVVVSPQDAQTMNEALLVAAGADATVLDNVGIRSYENVASDATATATVADSLTMREALQSTVVASTDLAVVQTMLSQVQSVITAQATVEDTFTPGASAPTQPVVSAAGGDTTVTISYVSGGTGATSYDLKWGTSAGSRPNTISGITLPYTHTGRTNGTTYYYSVVATNAQGSTESAEVSAAAVLAVINETFSSNLGAFSIESGTAPVTGGYVAPTGYIVAPMSLSKGMYVEFVPQIMSIDVDINKYTYIHVRTASGNSSDRYIIAPHHYTWGEDGLPYRAVYVNKVISGSETGLDTACQGEDPTQGALDGTVTVRVEFAASGTVTVKFNGATVASGADNDMSDFTHLAVNAGDGLRLHSISAGSL